MKPVLLIAELFFWDTEQKGVFRKIIETITPHAFYRGIETPIVMDAKERRALRSATEEHGLELMQWLTKSMQDYGLSICHSDASVRKRSITQIKQFVEYAAECGAIRLGFISGNDTGPKTREKEIGYLAESLTDIAGYMRKFKMEMILEPLDRDAHKKQLIGPTGEAVDLIKRLRKGGADCSLCWDSAHVALMGEDFTQSLTAAKGYASQMHLCNAVLDRTDPMFGDWHMMIGDKGYLTEDKAIEIIKAAKTTCAVDCGLERVGMEARTLQNVDPWANERACREFLQRVLKKAGEEISCR